MNRLIAAVFIAVLTTPAVGQDKAAPNIFDDLPKTPSTIGKTKPPTTIGELRRQITEQREREVVKCVLRYIDRAHTDLAVQFILASCQEWPRELDPRPERHSGNITIERTEGGGFVAKDDQGNIIDRFNVTQ